MLIVLWAATRATARATALRRRVHGCCAHAGGSRRAPRARSGAATGHGGAGNKQAQNAGGKNYFDHDEVSQRPRRRSGGFRSAPGRRPFVSMLPTGFGLSDRTPTAHRAIGLEGLLHAVPHGVPYDAQVQRARRHCATTANSRSYCLGSFLELMLHAPCSRRSSMFPAR